MRIIREFFSDHLSATIGVGLGLLAAGLFVVPAISWSQSVEVTETTARVIEVGPGESEQYQCGSVKVGDVTVPTYCTRTVYLTKFAVSETDAVFMEKVENPSPLGTEYTAYKVVDKEKYSYGLTDPSSVGSVILFIFLGLFLGLIVGVIAFMVSDHFLY